MTLSITTLSITTISIITLSIATLSITTLSKMTLSITVSDANHYAGCRYAEYRVFSLLSLVPLSSVL
jgi:hypothetical protein